MDAQTSLLIGGVDCGPPWVVVLCFYLLATLCILHGSFLLYGPYLRGSDIPKLILILPKIFDLLQVSIDASSVEFKKADCLKALEVHPDGFDATENARVVHVLEKVMDPTSFPRNGRL
jgi:hypothetical protein